MPYEELPITPALLTWARTRAGVSIGDAAATFRKIQAWEDGHSSPTYPQLEQLADAFKVPIAVFFFPGPRNTPVHCPFDFCKVPHRALTSHRPDEST
jgi:transcriptional regulator with XRE-family HTH domain